MKLLVLLHGFGDEPARLAALAPALHLPSSVDVVVPRGAVRADGGPAWVAADPSAGELQTALDGLEAEILDRGVPGPEVVVGGFSQGAAMALALGLRAGARIRPAGLFGLAGYLFAPDLVAYDLPGAVDLPVLLVHGTEDDAVPLTQGRSAARVLERAGLPVVFHEHEGIGHEPSPVFADDVRHWLPARAAPIA